MNWEYAENGAIYVTNIEIFNKYRCRLGGKIGFHVMPKERSLEIDTMMDFFLVERVMEYIRGGENGN